MVSVRSCRKTINLLAIGLLFSLFFLAGQGLKENFADVTPNAKPDLKRYASPSKKINDLVGIDSGNITDVAKTLERLSDSNRLSELKFDDFESDSKFFGLVELPDEMFAIAIGFFRQADGTSFLQVVTDNRTELVSTAVLNREGIESVWVMEEEPGLTMQRETLAFTFDKPWINLGVDDGSLESRAVFKKNEKNGQHEVINGLSIRNDGSEPLSIDKIMSSCGCLVAGDDEEKDGLQIASGETKFVEVKASLGGTSQYVHSLVFFISNSQGEKTAQRFNVFGNRILGSKRVSLDSIYLGELGSGTAKPFEFCVFERPDDRFELVDAEIVGDEFFDVEIGQAEYSYSGLAKFRVMATPKPAEFIKANFSDRDIVRGTLRIRTTSPQRKIVAVDVSGKLRDDKPIIDKVVALGAVSPGEYILSFDRLNLGKDSSIQSARTSSSALGVQLRGDSILLDFKKPGFVSGSVELVGIDEAGNPFSIDKEISAFVQ